MASDLAFRIYQEHIVSSVIEWHLLISKDDFPSLPPIDDPIEWEAS